MLQSPTMATSQSSFPVPSSANNNITTHRLVVVSYNLHGFNQGRPGIIDLINKLGPDAIMVQEHWLTPDNLFKLSKFSDDYFVFGSSAMNACISSGPLIGRPFGGTAIIIINKKYVSTTVNLISCDRYTAVKIANWLLITVYMPCVRTAQNDLLYSDILSELEALIAAHPNCQCLIGGDFNTSLTVLLMSVLPLIILFATISCFAVMCYFRWRINSHFSTNQHIVAVLLTIC
jgi:hypothetical protein